MELIICITMDLALNNLQRLICHKTQTTTKSSSISNHYAYLYPYNSIINIHFICITFINFMIFIIVTFFTSQFEINLFPQSTQRKGFWSKRDRKIKRKVSLKTIMIEVLSTNFSVDLSLPLHKKYKTSQKELFFFFFFFFLNTLKWLPNLTIKGKSKWINKMWEGDRGRKGFLPFPPNWIRPAAMGEEVPLFSLNTHTNTHKWNRLLILSTT